LTSIGGGSGALLADTGDGTWGAFGLGQDRVHDERAAQPGGRGTTAFASAPTGADRGPGSGTANGGSLGDGIRATADGCGLLSGSDTGAGAGGRRFAALDRIEAAVSWRSARTASHDDTQRHRPGG